MNKARVQRAINHIEDMMSSKAQQCASGQELAYHAKCCITVADNYEAETKSFGRGVPKALRAELVSLIAKLRDKAAEFASEDAQAARDEHTTHLRQISRFKRNNLATAC